MTMMDEQMVLVAVHALLGMAACACALLDRGPAALLAAAGSALALALLALRTQAGPAAAGCAMAASGLFAFWFAWCLACPRGRVALPRGAALVAPCAVLASQGFYLRGVEVMGGSGAVELMAGAVLAGAAVVLVRGRAVRLQQLALACAWAAASLLVLARWLPGVAGWGGADGFLPIGTGYARAAQLVEVPLAVATAWVTIRLGRNGARVAALHQEWRVCAIMVACSAVLLAHRGDQRELVALAAVGAVAYVLASRYPHQALNGAVALLFLVCALLLVANEEGALRWLAAWDDPWDAGYVLHRTAAVLTDVRVVGTGEPPVSLLLVYGATSERVLIEVVGTLGLAGLACTAACAASLVGGVLARAHGIDVRHRALATAGAVLLGVSALSNIVEAFHLAPAFASPFPFVSSGRGAALWSVAAAMLALCPLARGVPAARMTTEPLRLLPAPRPVVPVSQEEAFPEPLAQGVPKPADDACDTDAIERGTAPNSGLSGGHNDGELGARGAGNGVSDDGTGNAGGVAGGGA